MGNMNPAGNSRFILRENPVRNSPSAGIFGKAAKGYQINEIVAIYHRKVND
jgi:hypothetical protein